MRARILSARVVAALGLMVSAGCEQPEQLPGTAYPRILEPTESIVAGTVRVRGACDSPGTCRSLEAFAMVGGKRTRIGEGTDTVVGTYSVADLKAPSIQFVVRATDASGRWRDASTPELAVLGAPWWMVTSHAGLIDASPEWAAFVVEPSFLVYNVRTLRGVYGVAENNIHPGIPAVVTAAGALVNFGAPPVSTKPYGFVEYGGSGASNAWAVSLTARGRWAAWLGLGSHPVAQTLYRDDVLARQLDRTPPWLAVQSFQLAEDGTIVLMGGPYLDGECCDGEPRPYLWRGASLTPITSDSGTTVRGAMTDGSAIAYVQERSSSPRARLVYRRPDGVEEAMSAWTDTPPTILAMENGWMAFSHPGQAATLIRTPVGEVHEVWPGHGASFVSLGPHGEVVLYASATLYIADPPHAAATRFGPWAGIRQVKWYDGKLYTLRDQALFGLAR